MQAVIYVLVVALFAAWVLLFLDKIGFIEWLLVHGCDPFYKLASCKFCLSWWTTLALSVVFAISLGDIKYIAMAFLATPITRVLI